jgi:hypothetical protein
MGRRAALIAPLLLITACGGDGGDSSGSAGAPPTAAPAPTPSPTPAPAPTQTPTPSPSPSPTPSPSPIVYVRFTDYYIFRFGRDLSLPSACGALALRSQPPAVRPATAFGRGLTFRYVVTPQVWAVSGEVGMGFDGRDTDPLSAELAVRPEEIGLSRRIGPDVQRFSIAQPGAGGAGLEYARLASVWAPFEGAPHLYQCVIGVPTQAGDLPRAGAVAYRRGVMLGTAYRREGSAARAYLLDRSTVSVSVDTAADRVTISVRLIGTPAGGGPDVDLGAFAATGTIDAATGTFIADISGGDRGIAGALGGRFFGPEGVEIGAAISGSAPDPAGGASMTFAGGVFGVR